MIQQSVSIWILLKYSEIETSQIQTATEWDIVWYHSRLDWVWQERGRWAEFLPRNGTLLLFIGAEIQALVVCCYWDAKQEQVHGGLACYMFSLMSNVDICQSFWDRVDSRAEMSPCVKQLVNTLRSRQYGHHFLDDIFNCIEWKWINFN